LSEIRFYLDENVSPAVGEQLVKSGIDVVTTQDVEKLGDTDVNHLQRATQMGRVLCTHDTDFLRLSAEGIEHAGIAFAPYYKVSIVGSVVKALRELHASTTAEEMLGQVKFLSVK